MGEKTCQGLKQFDNCKTFYFYLDRSGTRHVNVIIPRPTVDQFYYLKKTAQIIRVTQEAGADDMLVHDPETDSSDGMSSETFVAHVQTGVWLLRPRPLA